MTNPRSLLDRPWGPGAGKAGQQYKRLGNRSQTCHDGLSYTHIHIYIYKCIYIYMEIVT